jgi:hypothetical protein
MVFDEGALFDLGAWRRQEADASFQEMLAELKAELWEEVPRLAPGELRRSKAYYESLEARLVAAHPWLDGFSQREPEEREEQEFALCRMILPLLRMEVERGTGKPQDSPTEPTRLEKKALETSASAPEPAIRAAPSKDQEPSNSSEKPKRVRRRKKSELPNREKKILEILKKAATEGKLLRGAVYCWTLEKSKIPPPQKWIDEGCPTTYPDAYKIAKWRKRIQDEKYRLSQFLPRKMARYSSRTSLTLHKRVKINPRKTA